MANHHCPSGKVKYHSPKQAYEAARYIKRRPHGEGQLLLINACHGHRAAKAVCKSLHPPSVEANRFGVAIDIAISVS